MLTSFGKFCRKLRIDEGKLLLDMAQQLRVSSAFLSKVENGKAKPPVEWEDIIKKEYNLSDDQTMDDRDMMLAFARKLDTMDPEEKEKIRKLLSR